MTAAASPSDILRAVERWARVREFWRPGFSSGHPEWSIQTARHGLELWAPGAGVPSIVSPALALAWALLVETGAEPVDVGRCPACVARSLPGRKLATTEWVQTDGHYQMPRKYSAENFGREPWRLESHYISGTGYVQLASRPCPACTGTGREIIPAERLLLDAASGDATARDLLLVRSDELQAAADPIGDLLAWALRLWTGEPTEVVTVNRLPLGTLDAIFGHPHTAEAVAWLDRLTDEREALDENRQRIVFESHCHSMQWLDLGWAILNEAKMHGAPSADWIMMDIQIARYNSPRPEMAMVTATYAALNRHGERITVQAAVDSLRGAPRVHILRPLDRDFGPRPSDGWGMP